MPEPDPRVVTVLREYREAMAARELAVLEDMTGHWIKVEQRLSGDMAALQMVMAEKAGKDLAITQQMIWKEERYQILQGKLAEEIKTYNSDYLIPTISKAQSEFGWFGVEASTEAIKASYLGSAPIFPVLNRGAVEAMAGFLGNGAPLSTLIKNDYPEALEGITDALISGITRGINANDIAAEMAEGMANGLDRAMLIARTETNRAYRSASAQEYRESGVVLGFRRLVYKATACMACLFLDGERFDLQSELDDHPRGKCQAVPEVRGVGAPKWEVGSDWFNTLDPAQQEEKLGPELFEKWQKEGFDLTSLVSKSHSEEWGAAPRFNVSGGG